MLLFALLLYHLALYCVLEIIANCFFTLISSYTTGKMDRFYLKLHLIYLAQLCYEFYFHRLTYHT